MSETELVNQVLPVVASFLIGLIAMLPRYIKAKGIIHAVREFVDNTDDMIYDDKVTEPEFRKTWDSGRKVINKILS